MQLSGSGAICQRSSEPSRLLSPPAYALTHSTIPVPPDQVALTGNAGPTPTFSILPQALPTGQAAAGRVFQLSYTAAVPQTGLSCSGTADICFSANGISCGAFGSTGVSLDALACT